MLPKKALGFFVFFMTSMAVSAQATNLSIDKNVLDDFGTAVVEVAPGDPIVYEIIVTDSSEGVLGVGVSMTDTVPSEILITSVETDFGTCNFTNNQVTCDLNGIADGATVTITIAGILSDNTVVGNDITNTAQVTASNEIQPQDNTDSITFTVGAETINDPDSVSDGSCSLNTRVVPTRLWRALRKAALN